MNYIQFSKYIKKREYKTRKEVEIKMVTYNQINYTLNIIFHATQ